VTTWGIVALVLAGIAVMGANVSALMPPSLLAGLHKTRIGGASLEQLRSQVADLREETQRLRRENSVLAARFALEEQQGNEVTRRVGALEVSLPRLLEALPDNAQVDLSNLTASIGGAALVYEADGGTVEVRQQPMIGVQPNDQPLPAPVQNAANATTTSPTGYGIALGQAVDMQEAPEAWRDLSMKLGPLLFGLSPMLVDETGSDKKRIIVGPLLQLSEASALCARLERMSVSCMPRPFTGTPLVY
jgi:hypothetical protein